MAKVKYSAKENTRVGTHSFYAVPIPTGRLSFRELCEEACEDNSFSVEEMQGCVSKFMKTVQREALRGWRCQLGDEFLTIYPNIDASIKDYKDPKTGQTVVVTADMLTAQGAKSRLGCSVHKKFSAKFAAEVSWQKVNANGTEIDEEDITQGNENVDGGVPSGGGNNGGGSSSSDSSDNFNNEDFGGGNGGGLE